MLHRYALIVFIAMLLVSTRGDADTTNEIKILPPSRNPKLKVQNERLPFFTFHFFIAHTYHIIRRTRCQIVP